jgi:hypothetical protein
VPDEIDLLKDLGRELAEPDDASIERARRLLEQRAGATPPTRASGRPRLRWAMVIAAVALLAGSGLGFGVGSSLTPNGTAGSNVAGIGFIPVDGWEVTQTGVIGETGVAKAVAANVSIDPADEERDLPLATLRALPPTGAVIVARLFPRGDQLEDSRFPLRTLPLRLADAIPVEVPPSLAETSLVALRLRAATSGYNIDVAAFTAQGSRATRAALSEQLRRLVVAPTRVTLVVQPTIVPSSQQRMTIYGSVDSGKANEKVVVQFKPCGLLPPQFRDVLETTTRAGGGYSFAELQPFGQGVSGVYRAVSGDSISAEIPVWQRASVYLRAERGRFVAAVWATVQFWRRYVVLQRFDRRRGVWVNVQRIVLTEQVRGGPAPPFQRVATVSTRTEPFRPKVPRGTQIRVVFPLSQAKPCYIAGVSEVRRT